MTQAKYAVVTGAAGFIGSQVAMRLLKEGHSITGIDCLDDYYDVRLKRARLERLMAYPGFRFLELDLCSREEFLSQIAEDHPRFVFHLAARVGVRASVIDPFPYAQSNLVGFLNVLEACRRNGVEHLLFASSSSVYGAGSIAPYREDEKADRPLSFYAATKRANELMAYSYSHLYGLPCTAYRFFTVYGPWGRPDMAPYRFLRAMMDGQEITVFNRGRVRRAFTYVDDVVECVCRGAEGVPASREDDQSPRRESPPIES